MNSPRWITIAKVQRRYVIIRNSGYPGGLRVFWHGRTHVFQTVEFILWDHLIPAVRNRLAMANLELVAVASRIPPDGYLDQADLICQVKRGPCGRPPREGIPVK